MATELDDACLAHIKGTGMNVRKYKKIANFVDGILKKEAHPDEDVLLKQFAQKCYASFNEKDGLRQAKKFLKILFGDDLKILVKQGASEALRLAATGAPIVTRIVRLNRPQDGFTKKLDKYFIGETLGKGATSKVKLGRNEETGQEVALKFLTGGSFSQEDLKEEIKILQKLDHKNVIKVFDYFDNVESLVSGSGADTTTVIVLELATKGEFFDFFMYTGHFEPPLARWFFAQMIEGLEYCHNNGVAHRDLKPENCLLGDNFTVKLVDFGFSTVFKNEETGHTSLMKTALGTPGYAAPEILKRRKYNKSVDIFSMGVILFITIAGFPPFQEAKPDTDWWFNKLQKKDYKLFWKAHERTAKFSDSAKQLLQGMLAADPNDRWTIQKIKNCAWYKDRTLVQSEAVDALLKRKEKVEKEKLAKAAGPEHAGTNRGDSSIRAPPIGAYRPANLFMCTPGLDADDIRAWVKDIIIQKLMAKTENEYIDTGDATVPECPDEIDPKDWKPWYDVNFVCELKEPSGSAETPDMNYNFAGGVYIREDTSYVPPEDHKEWRRHVVYFKRHMGLAHKWIKVMFKIKNQLGFLNSPDCELPDVSPMKTTQLGPDVSGLLEVAA